ncbi:MAG: pilin [Candidatus Pacebacteria bacterium]|nr:pilin [Candidatus Paceibacterota bacterium]
MLPKKLLAITIFILTFLIARTVFALEVSWPSIPGAPTLSNNSSIADFTIYSYAFFVAIGTLIAVIVLIIAGVELIITHNIAKTRPRIIGALVGILVLVVPYSLLGLINPKLREPTTSILSCEDTRVCINRRIITETINEEDEETSEEKNIEEMSLNSMAKINEETTTTTKNGDETKTTTIKKKQEITIKKFKGLQNIIGFSEENYAGTATMIFKSSPNSDNLDKDIPSEIVISGEEYKSFQVVTKTPQMYFYDKENYEVEVNPPLQTTVGFYDLTKKTINSIDIVNPYSSNIDHIGLMFNDVGYKTKCATFNKDIPSIKNDVFLKKANGGSLKIYSRNKEYLAGSKILLTLYNNTSCAERVTSTEEDLWKQNRKCEITLIGNNEEIPDPTKDLDEDAKVEATCDEDKYTCKVTLKSTNTIAFPKKIIEMCPNIGGKYNSKGEEVLSFRMDSSGVVVFLDKNETCNVWELLRVGPGESDCNRVNSTGFNPDASFRPYKFFVIPYGGSIKGDIKTTSYPTCGDAGFKEFDSAPTADLCDTGTASAVTGNGPWTWTCSNEGETVSCSTQNCDWVCDDWGECINEKQTRYCVGSPSKCQGGPITERSCVGKINGVCGASNGEEFDSAPTENLCETGTASDVTGDGPWTWTCKGSDGGKNDECKTVEKCVCGASNGGEFYSQPEDLCEEDCSGYIKDKTGNKWRWDCSADEKETVSCSAERIIPSNGVCGKTDASFSKPTWNLCLTGTPTAVEYKTIDNKKYWYWQCSGDDKGTGAKVKSTLCYAEVILFAQCSDDDTPQDCWDGNCSCFVGTWKYNIKSTTEEKFNAWYCSTDYNTVECGVNDRKKEIYEHAYKAECGKAHRGVYPEGIPSNKGLLCKNESVPYTDINSPWTWSCVSKYSSSSALCWAYKNEQ